MKARHEFQSDEEYQEYLKTYFAAMAMQGYLSGFAGRPNIEFPDDNKVAEWSVKSADALLNQLNPHL